uniref:Uncharacterized protein n=1 Tax=Hanusia phi TaxID=3032 RepID=A0A7S0EUQ5_9CRYP
MGFGPCILYSLSLLSNVESTGMQQSIRISMLYCLLVLAPLAVLFQSSLMGFLSCMIWFDLCGFSIQYIGIGYSIGFETHRGLIRCLVVSFFFLSAYLSLAITNPPAHIIHFARPFSKGMTIVGSMVYFISLLILSHPWISKGRDYLCANSAMLVSLVVCAGIGSVWRIDAVTNISCTYAVLWAMEKQFEVVPGHIAPAFIFFCSLYYIAHFIQTRPHFLLCMVDPDCMTR